MTVTNLDEFRPPVCGTGENGRFLLAEAKSHALGVTEPMLRKQLAMLWMEYPDWMAKTRDYVSRHAYAELLAGVLAPGQPIYYLAVQQYASAHTRLRLSTQSGSIMGWHHCNFGVAAALGDQLQTVEFLTLLRAASAPVLQGYLLLILGLLRAKIEPTIIVRRRKPETVALAGIQALTLKHRQDLPLTFRPFKSESVRVLTTIQELEQIAFRMNNCLWAPEWAVGTLLGRFRIVFVDMGDVQAVAELVPCGDSWTPGLILGKGNRRLDPVLYERVRQHIVHEMRSGQSGCFDGLAVPTASSALAITQRYDGPQKHGPQPENR